MNAPEFEKTEEGRAFLGGLLGNGWPRFLDIISLDISRFYRHTSR